MSMVKKTSKTKEAEKTCAICGCPLHRTAGTYAKPTADGRSHATDHHCVPKRFLSDKNTKGEKRGPVLTDRHWAEKGSQTVTLCYDCHEELLHNPILLEEDVKHLRQIMDNKGCTETHKTEGDYKCIANRVRIFHEIIKAGIEHTLKEPK